MNNKKSVLAFRTVAVVTFLVALYALPGLIKIIRLELTYSYEADMNTGIYGWDLLWTLWIAFLLILKIMAAYGLFRLRTWAWVFSIWVFSADFLTRLFGIFSLWLNRQPGPPPVLHENKGQIVVLQSFSHWPIYFMAVLSLVFIIILLQKPINKVFNKPND